ncbi:MAG: hypothetical protein EXS22_04425 [Pedosphaera sp.]|nr:hypothetical protein [Pedosphaera sp.]
MEIQTEKHRRAVIDVGSNSVKLLVADCANGTITPVHHSGEQTRLGHGAFSSGQLQAEAIAKTAHAVTVFAKRARTQGAESIRVLATSAAREAANGEALIIAVREASGLELEIIPAQKEAALVLAGARSTPGLGSSAFSVVDVGGGSTEVLVADGAQVFFQDSFPLGTVRWLEQTTLSDPLTTEDWQRTRQSIEGFVTQHIAPRLVPALAAAGGVSSLVGAGGTPVFLLRVLVGRGDLSFSELDHGRLSREQVESVTARLWSLPLAARQRLPGLPANRADVILFGAAIFWVLMRQFGFTELRPTLRGVRFGALLMD